MSFLHDDNLTFHRFAADDSRRPSDDNMINNGQINTGTTNTFKSNTNTLIITNIDDDQRNFTPSVWTTSTSNSKSNYTTGTNDFQYISAGVHDISTKTLQMQNGSTAKLLPAVDDQTSKQVSRLCIRRSSTNNLQVSAILFSSRMRGKTT